MGDPPHRSKRNHGTGNASVARITAFINMPAAEILLKPEILLNLQKEGLGSRDTCFGFWSEDPRLFLVFRIIPYFLHHQVLYWSFCLDGGLSCSKHIRRSLGSYYSSCSSGGINATATAYPSAERIVLEEEGLDPEKLELVCQTESCDINVQNYRGYSALHFLIKGCSPSSFPSVLKCLNILIACEINNLIREASTLALLLLKAGGDINVVNNEGRTLLSYAVAVPEAEKLVHLLLDYGALVWPSRVCTIAARKNKEEDVVESLIREREESAFTWFIKSTLKHCEIRPGHLKILYLLCHSMSEEEGDPRRMKRRVLSTMIHYGRSYRVMGPIFSQLKRIISPFWTQPQPLKYLCKRKIRKAVGGGSVPRDLYLPKSLRDYLELERTEFLNEFF
ncbi:unnamed protein product [Lepeophtheirus salmonis]|uniref:(salmon louse) hypothetical protein n=1 Tax=Lepeophtheirus salmonis TaxID=72036 RepID=A0A7R8CMZ7_LEPSM|nr:unnamed protein product [Lepeophtheirus salmonis]CAF2837732.1 unnamed protein product [Lepeophtheirus salmonis]